MNGGESGIRGIDNYEREGLRGAASTYIVMEI